MHLEFPGDGGEQAATREFTELAHSAGVEVASLIGGRRRTPDSKYFVGSGKADEIAAAVETTTAELIIINHDLSPSQERNLEARVKCRVLDRTGLILDIFAQRAHSHEGKLQVELAQLQHLSTRLVRGWSHLERQKGGIGLRGPGETQLETDRRLVYGRIRQIRRRLEKVRSQRELGRKARRRAEMPQVSLVGYTNAGKSTLFNRLTGADAFVADQLFATLDPTVRRLPLPVGGAVVLTDTVGFVRDLPHDLVAAFRATLEETRQADCILRVIDASDPERADRIAQVSRVLDEIGAADVPQIQVYNKIDLCPDREPGLMRDADGEVRKVFVSAVTGAGIEELKQALLERFHPDLVDRVLTVPPHAGRLRSRLFQAGAVRDEHVSEHGDYLMHVALPLRQLQRICRQEGFDAAKVQ